MTVESVTFISDFNTANPGAGDLKSEGDDHIRNIKIGVKGSFPNLVGAASPGSMGTSLGLVGTPAYSFTGDADTGMWSPGANTLAWSLAGAEVGRWTSTGLGIGRTPTSALDVAVTDDARLSLDGTGSGTGSGGTVLFYRTSSLRGSIGVAANRLADSGLGLLIHGTSGIAFRAGAGAGSEWLNLTSDGRLYGIALHNNAGSVTGTNTQYIASGTYTPTFTALANVTGTPTATTTFKWIRVGNVVTVSGQANVNYTAGAAVTSFTVTLPIASTLATGDLSGTCGPLNSTGAARVMTDPNPNNRANPQFTSSGTGANTVEVWFQYEVK